MDIRPPDLSDLVAELRGRGVGHITLLMRHGAREYDRSNPDREAFLPLTDHGRQQSRAFGRRLLVPSARFESSPIPRCCETAQQVAQGCAERGAETTPHVVEKHLGPFFLLEARRVVQWCIERGAQAVFADWLAGNDAHAALMPVDEAYEHLLQPLVEGLSAADAPAVRVCVTHDAHLYLARARALGEDPIAHGPVRYLDGIALFEDAGHVYAASPRTQPRRLG